jgi:Peptidase family M28
MPIKSILATCILFYFNTIISVNAQSEIYAKTIRDCQLKKHLTFLASDSLKGRDTGSEGQKIAANYVARHYADYGLKPIIKNADSSLSYFQTYGLQRSKMMGGGYNYLPMKDKRRGVVDTVTTENVLGFLEGTDKKNEVVVISAHLDHIGVDLKGHINNGADDDGSGSVALLELAQAFTKAKKAGFGPRRSILFLNVTGEEKGLLGSKYFVENPPFPLKNIVCDLNIDMIGRTDVEHEGKPDYIYLIGSDKLSSSLHAISEKANADHTMLALDYTFNNPDDPNRFYYRSDHYNFAEKKIPVIFYFRGVHADYHMPGDDVEKIQFDQTEKITRLVFYTAWELANREERIVVDSDKK